MWDVRRILFKLFSLLVFSRKSAIEASKTSNLGHYSVLHHKVLYEAALAAICDLLVVEEGVIAILKMPYRPYRLWLVEHIFYCVS